MKAKMFMYGMMGCVAVLCSAYSPDPGTPHWYGNNHFKITERENVVSVAMMKMPWESFSVNLEDLVSAEGVVSFEIKSDVPLTLRADGFTHGNTQVELFNEQISANEYQQVYYNFSSREAGISHILFYVNPGKQFSGNVQFRNVKTVGGSDASMIRTYPNPTAGEVNVQLPDTRFNQISIYDAAGRMVMTRKPDGLNTKINMSNQRAGIYLLKAKSNSAMLTTKIIVE